jgi:alkylation response protein AidB-like acyl-CoA dehydrogenase
MNFGLNDEQRMIKETAARIADSELKPRAAAADKQHRVDERVLDLLAENGFMGVVAPYEYGGAELDYVAYALILTEISRGCASTATIMSVNNSLYGYPLLTYGNAEQKERFLTPVASGAAHGCFGLTEAGAGSDAGGLRCTATACDGGYILNGEKKFITNGDIASYAVIAAVTDKSAGAKGISQFVVDLKHTPGFKVGKLEEKLGIRGSGTAELIFEEAFVPKDCLLGSEGQGFKQMLSTLDSGRIGIAAQALGIAKACLEESLKYAAEREQFGKPLSAFQAIQFKLADMATHIDAAEMLILKAAWLESQGQNFEKEAAQAKMYASDTAMTAAIEAVQILGGYGYTCEYPVERLMRDAKITQIYEGTNEIMRLVIARKLLSQR